MMNKVEKYITKNGVTYEIGNWIKESWHFHGFCGSGSFFEAQEFVNKDKSFRFVKFDGSQVFDENRVNRQGWPVSGYEIEVVSEDYIREINKNPSYGYSGNRRYGEKPYYYGKGIAWLNFKNNEDWKSCKNELGEDRIRFNLKGDYKFKA